MSFFMVKYIKLPHESCREVSGSLLLQPIPFCRTQASTLRTAALPFILRTDRVLTCRRTHLQWSTARAPNIRSRCQRGPWPLTWPPGASLSVMTASTLVSVNKKNSLVQKVSMEKSGRVLGVISSSDKGTEVRCISGRVAIEVTPSETKLISSGESIFVDASSTYKVYNTQAIQESSDDRRRGGAFWQNEQPGAYIVGGIFLTTAGVISFDVWKGSGGVASPSGF